MSRYKLVVQYDGSEFSGWQLQKKSRTVQGVLEDAVQKITNSPDRIPVHGSGRTDAGVHAWAQVAHTDMKLKLSVDRIKRALNGNLPQDCRIVGVEHTHNDFHSRYDAKSRYYRYQCYIGDSILYRNQSWAVPNLDIELLNTLQKLHLKGQPLAVSTKGVSFCSKNLSNKPEAYGDAILSRPFILGILSPFIKFPFASRN